MTSRLASLLVQEGLVQPKQMADAFQRQVIYGGALDTILLEMNAVAEPALIAALGRASALPTAEIMPAIERLQAAGALSWFPLALAEKFRAVPLSVEGQIVRVLTTDPPDRRALDELGLQIGRAVEAVIAPEHRFMHALSMVYDATIPARFQSLQARLARRATQTSTSTVVTTPVTPPRTMVSDLPAEAAPQTANDARETPRLTTREHDAPAHVMREQVVRESIAPGPITEQRPVVPDSAPLRSAAAIELIEAATDRDEIFLALCRGARSRAEYVALFTIHSDMMIGRVALADTWIERNHLSTISMSLEALTPFRTSLVGRSPLVGRVGEDPVSLTLLRLLGREAPLAAAIVPIVLRDRAVALLYADSNDKGFAPSMMGELSNSTAAAARAFQRLILSAKGKDYRAASPQSAGDSKLAATALSAVEPAPASGWRKAEDTNAGRLSQNIPAVSDADTARHAAPTISDAEAPSLFLSVERGDDESRTSADRLIALGTRGAELTVARMPGPIRIDRASYRGPTPPLSDHGPLLALLPRFGDLCLPFLERRIDDAVAEVRFYTTLALGELGRETRLHLIGPRLYDRDAGVRKAAVDILARLPASPARTSIVESLRGELPGPDVEHQRMSAEALGVLGDAQSVPRLVELVKHEDAGVQTAARRALIQITKQDFGTSRWRWRGWWDRHKNTPRIEWMFDGLAHSDDEVRASAESELKRQYSEHFGYHWDSPKREREEARKKWFDWYQQSRG